MKVFPGKNEQNDIFEMLPKAISVLKKNIIRPFISSNLVEKYTNERPPLRAELFSAEQKLEISQKCLQPLNL